MHWESKLKFSKEHAILESKVILQQNFEKKKVSQKDYRISLHCVVSEPGRRCPAQQTSIFHLIYPAFWAKAWKAKQPKGQLSQNTYVASPWPLGQQGEGARAQAMLVPPASMASQLPGSYGQGSNKTSPARWKGKENSRKAGRAGNTQGREQGHLAHLPNWFYLKV